jgi:hypothetical protein
VNSSQIENDQWFYCVSSEIEETTTLSAYCQQKAIQELQNIGYLEVERRDIPAKLYFKINLEEIQEFFTPKNLETSYKETRKLVPKKLGNLFQRNSETNINTINKKELLTKGTNNKKRIRNLFPQNIKISQFDEFWKLYPRKVDKGKALTIWKRLANKKDSPNWTDIKNALQEQIDTDRWKTPKFIPHPATWLNQSRWLDDPSEMKSYSREDEKPVSGYTDSEPLKYKTARKV